MSIAKQNSIKFYKLKYYCCLYESCIAFYLWITVKKDSSIQPTTLRTIIVDDEQSAQDVLENLLDRYCPSVQLLDKCSNVEEAVASIEKNQPDIVFLDIEMPNYAGYELVSFFETVNFDIIFITAYDHYAIKAFEVSAVDYLLKPVDIERLKSAVDKVQEKKDRKNSYRTISDS